MRSERKFLSGKKRETYAYASFTLGIVVLVSISKISGNPTGISGKRCTGMDHKSKHVSDPLPYPTLNSIGSLFCVCQ